LPPVDPEAPEVAFLGKSNVGKSSLLNALLLRKNLVKTSKTPGQTRLLNQFRVELQLRRRRQALTLVDLSGYGFAKTSKAEHARLGGMLQQYLGQRAGLSLLVHLFDLRHPPTAQDITIWDELSALASDRVVVGTKADRVPSSKRQMHAKVLAKGLGVATDDVVIFSSESREGRSRLWGRILSSVGKLEVEDNGDAPSPDVDAPPAVPEPSP
jgi:GTP-binding protein